MFALEGSWMSDGRWIRERGFRKGVQGEEEEVFPVTPIELMERVSGRALPRVEFLELSGHP